MNPHSPNRSAPTIGRVPHIVNVGPRRLTWSGVTIPTLLLFSCPSWCPARVKPKHEYRTAEAAVSERHRGFEGGQGRGRTADLWFFRPALCQLSYLTVSDSGTAQ